MSEKKEKTGNVEAKAEAKPVVAEEKPSDVGVFVCNWGINIAGVVNVPDVVEAAKRMPGVKYAEKNLSYCTEAGAVAIQKAIDEQKLKRVVIAAWTPKTHLPVFQSVLKAANLPKRMLEFVNIREQDSFVHMHEKDAATDKAKSLIASAVERAKNLEDIPTEIVDVTKKALVIGGGVAGLQAALDLAKLEYDVTVVEKSPTTGGKMAKLDRTFPTDDCSIWILGPIMLEANRNPKIRTLTYSEIDGFSGFVGNFDVRIRKKARYTTSKCNGCGSCFDVCPAYRPHDFEYGMAQSKAIYKSFAQAVPGVVQIDKQYCIDCGMCAKVCELQAVDYNQKDEIIEEKFGIVVVASGFTEYLPPMGTLGFGQYENVITQGRLERILAPNGPTVGHLMRPSDGKHPARIAFVQCVGSRDTQSNPHCCTTGCLLSVKNSKLIKQHYPDTEITVIFMDLRCTGKMSEEYSMATREAGVHFIRSNVGRVWEDEKTKNILLRFEDTMNPGTLQKLEVDMLILTTNMVLGEEGTRIAKMLKLDMSPDGFLKEYHARLDPISTKVPGIFLAGTCQGPMNIAESIGHAKGAASSAARILQAGKYEIELIRAVVEKQETCSKCYRCVEACPYKAISIDEDGKINVDVIMCKGCGTCSNVCRSQTIQLRYYRDPGFDGAIDALFASAAPQDIKDSSKWFVRPKQARNDDEGCKPFLE